MGGRSPLISFLTYLPLKFCIKIHTKRMQISRTACDSHERIIEPKIREYYNGEKKRWQEKNEASQPNETKRHRIFGAFRILVVRAPPPPDMEEARRRTRGYLGVACGVGNRGRCHSHRTRLNRIAIAAFYNDIGKVVIKWNCSAEMRCNAFYLYLVLSGCDKKKRKYNSRREV